MVGNRIYRTRLAHIGAAGKRHFGAGGFRPLALEMRRDQVLGTIQADFGALHGHFVHLLGAAIDALKEIGYTTPSRLFHVPAHCNARGAYSKFILSGVFHEAQEHCSRAWTFRRMHF